MSGQWQLTAQASAAQATAAVTSGTVAGQAIRLRSVFFSVSGTGAGALTVVVRDGTTGAGTIIWQGSLNSAANGGNFVLQNDIDVRATSGTLTVESTASGGANTVTSLNASGDYVQLGASYLGGA